MYSVFTSVQLAEPVMSQQANVPPFISMGRKRDDRATFTRSLHGIRMNVSELEWC